MASIARFTSLEDVVVIYKTRKVTRLEAKRDEMVGWGCVPAEQRFQWRQCRTSQGQIYLGGDGSPCAQCLG